jgi:hypothetical protein
MKYKLGKDVPVGTVLYPNKTFFAMCGDFGVGIDYSTCKYVVVLGQALQKKNVRCVRVHLVGKGKRYIQTTLSLGYLGTKPV